MKKPVAWMVTWEWKDSRGRWRKECDLSVHKCEVDAMTKALRGPNASGYCPCEKCCGRPVHRNVRGPVPLVERDDA